MYLGVGCIKKLNVQNSIFCHHAASSAGNPPWLPRCLDSLQMFCVFSEQISQVGHRQHGSLRVLHSGAGVTRIQIKPYQSCPSVCLSSQFYFILFVLLPFVCGLQHGLHSLFNGGFDEESMNECWPDGQKQLKLV